MSDTAIAPATETPLALTWDLLLTWGVPAAWVIGGIVIGLVVFGGISQLMGGNMRYSLLALIVFFILGLIFLLQLRGRTLREGSPDAPEIFPGPPVASAVASTPSTPKG